MFLASFFHKFYARDNYFFLLLNVCYKIKVVPQDGGFLVWVFLFCFFSFFNLSSPSMVRALFCVSSGPLVGK